MYSTTDLVKIAKREIKTKTGSIGGLFLLKIETISLKFNGIIHKLVVE